MEQVFIFDQDEIMASDYIIKAIGKEKIESNMDEKRLKTFMKNRERALTKIKNNINCELHKIQHYIPIIEDK